MSGSDIELPDYNDVIAQDQLQIRIQQTDEEPQELGAPRCKLSCRILVYIFAGCWIFLAAWMGVSLVVSGISFSSSSQVRSDFPQSNGSTETLSINRVGTATVSVTFSTSGTTSSTKIFSDGSGHDNVAPLMQLRAESVGTTAAAGFFVLLNHDDPDQRIWEVSSPMPGAMSTKTASITRVAFDQASKSSYTNSLSSNYIEARTFSEPNTAHRDLKSPQAYHNAYPVHYARPVDNDTLAHYAIALHDCAQTLLRGSYGRRIQVSPGLQFTLNSCKSVMDGALRDLFVGTGNEVSPTNTVSKIPGSTISEALEISQKSVAARLIKAADTSSVDYQPGGDWYYVTETPDCTSIFQPRYTPNWFTGRNCTPETYCAWVNTPNGLDRCMYRNESRSDNATADDHVNKTMDDFRLDAPEECNFCLPEVSLYDLEQYCINVARAEGKAMKGLLWFAGAVISMSIFGMLSRCIHRRRIKQKSKKLIPVFRRPLDGIFDGVGDSSTIGEALKDTPLPRSAFWMIPFCLGKSRDSRGELPSFDQQNIYASSQVKKQGKARTWQASVANLKANLPPHPVLYDELEDALANNKSPRSTTPHPFMLKWFRARRNSSSDSDTALSFLTKEGTSNRTSASGSTDRIRVIPNTLGQLPSTSSRKTEQSSSQPPVRQRTSRSKEAAANDSKSPLTSAAIPVMPNVEDLNRALSSEYEPGRRDSLALSMQQTPPEIYPLPKSVGSSPS